MPAELINTQNLADMTDVSERRIRQRSQRENWPTLKVAGRGGSSGQLIPSLLPADVRQAVAQNGIEKAGLVIARDIVPSMDGPVAIPEKVKEAGLARYQLVHGFRTVLKAAPWGTRQTAEDGFVLSYNAKRLYPNIYNVIGEVTAKSLRAWDTKLKKANDDYTVLCDGRGGWRTGTRHKPRVISDEAKELLVKHYLQPTRPSVMACIRVVRAALNQAGIVDASSDATWRRWLKEFCEVNTDMVTLGRDGEKAYMDKVGSYITRKNVTPGECLMADGHVLNALVRHPKTGQPIRPTVILYLDWGSRVPLGWSLMPTESTYSILSAFRMACMNLGKYPKCVYLDNGKAFKSEFFTKTNPDLSMLEGLYARVGTLTQFATPYRGRSKSQVERFFGTFNEQYQRYLGQYVGNCIADKPAHMMRNETFHKQLHEKRTGDYIPTIQEMGEMMERYFAWYVNQPHRGLNNQTPYQAFLPHVGEGIPLDQLNYDFLNRVEKTPRSCRITHWGIDYTAEFMHGYGRKIIMAYDTSDLRTVYCYSLEQHFLGEAVAVEALHPLANKFGGPVSEDKVKQALKGQKRDLKKTKAGLRALGVADADVCLLGGLGLDQKKPVTLTPQIETEEAPAQLEAPEDFEAKLAEAEAMQKEGEMIESDTPEDDGPVIDAEYEQVDPMTDERDKLDRMMKPERYERLMELEAQGVDIGQNYRNFMRYFVETEAYRKQKAYYEERRNDLALAYR